MLPSYKQLFFTFLKIGAFTFGGGYAMLSLIENEVVVKNHWVDRDTFYDYVSIAQMSPGILAVNISILIGNFFRGKKGGLLCVVATCLPAFLTILTISIFFVRFREIESVNNIFKGIRPIVVTLILMPVLSLCQKAKINFATSLIPISVVVLITFFKISPVYIIGIAIIIAVILAKVYK